jgi:hypothetical protein
VTALVDPLIWQRLPWPARQKFLRHRALEVRALAPVEPPSRVIREWARSEGIEVAPTGKVPGVIVAAYLAAQARAA